MPLTVFPKTKRLLIAGAFCLSVGGLAMYGFSYLAARSERVIHTVPNVPVADKANGESPATRVVKAAPVVQPPSGPDEKKALAQDYFSDRDGRIFVLNHWNDGYGGKFYSSRLVDYCKALRETVPVLDEAQPDVGVVGQESYLAASRSLDRLKRRCSQFSSSELDQYSGHALLRDGVSDTLSSLAANLEKGRASYSAQRDVALGEVLTARDPLLFDQLGIRLFLVSTGANDKSFLYYDGKRYGLNDNSDLSAATYLIPCNFGADCGASDIGLQISCVSGAGCYSSREAKILEQFAGGSQDTVNRIIALSNSISESIKSGDYSKFFVKSP